MAEAAPGFKDRPDHIVYITSIPGVYRVDFMGDQIAQSSAVLEVTETNCITRLYMPVDDVDMSRLQETDHNSYCPFKGTARYWTVSGSGESLENGAWAYDDPYAECKDLTGYICFYSEKPGFEIHKK